MSRKEPSFGQLIEYMQDIDKSDERYNVYQNIFGRKAEDIQSEFQENARLVKKRKNGIYLYHEILSIKVTDTLERKQQKSILRDIAYQYAQSRAERNLIFGTLHDDHEEHLHYHLLVSSNARGESKKTRLSKAQFAQFKQSMESLVLENYPELKQEVVIGREAGEKLSRSGAERKRRTGETPKRDETKSKLHRIFTTAADKQELFEMLADAGMEFYVRGKTLGVKNLETGRKHRLKTLGLLESFQQLSDRVEQAATLNKKAKAQDDIESSSKAENRVKEAKSDNQARTEAADVEVKHKAEMKALREEKANTQSSQKKFQDK